MCSKAGKTVGICISLVFFLRPEDKLRVKKPMLFPWDLLSQPGRKYQVPTEFS